MSERGKGEDRKLRCASTVYAIHEGLNFDSYLKEHYDRDDADENGKNYKRTQSLMMRLRRTRHIISSGLFIIRHKNSFLD